MGFPGSSAGEESACNTGDPGSIPGLGRSSGEGISYQLQYFGASLESQMIKNLPAGKETWVWSLGWEDPLEEGMATIPAFLPGESPWTEEPGGLQSMGLWKVRHNWATKQSTAPALARGSLPMSHRVTTSYRTRVKTKLSLLYQQAVALTIVQSAYQRKEKVLGPICHVIEW